MRDFRGFRGTAATFFFMNVMSDKKRVILVSPYPFTQTGRGMDVLTSVFAGEGWDTTHLLFPKVLYSVKKTKKFPTNVKERTSRRAVFPYIDSLMFWFPKFLFKLYVRYAQSKARNINWKDYDFVVLESGKPLFLLDLIPSQVKLIYRQSDSVRLVLGKGKWYVELEDRACRRAHRIITVKDYYLSTLPEDTVEKAVTIRNGFSIPEGFSGENPYPADTLNAVYVGLTPLDSQTIEALCLSRKDVDFHIFGNCMKPWEVRKLRKHENFRFYGFRSRDEYLPYLANADAAIFPFKRTRAMRHVGFTTKYLNFMYFRLPIVSYLTGDKEEFTRYPIWLPENSEAFCRDFNEAMEAGSISYDVDFDFFSQEGRKREYETFISGLNNI